MQTDLVAPCPKKPTSTGRSYPQNDSWFPTKEFIDLEDVENACLELQQILQENNQRHHEHFIVRAGNPLIQDSCFIPLHQAVSQLHVCDTTVRRPRSLSVGDPRNIIQPQPCKPVF